jgi:hypothetical protein
MRDVRFQLTRLHAALMNEGLCVITEAGDNLCQIIIKFASDFKVGDNLLVLQISIL